MKTPMAKATTAWTLSETTRQLASVICGRFIKKNAAPTIDAEQSSARTSAPVFIVDGLLKLYRYRFHKFFKDI
jgi:hypothetical protein